MVFTIGDGGTKKCTFESALDLTGFGKYNLGMLLSCCLMILAMYLDMFGFSVVMPALACDLSLTTSQQGLLSAIPLIGVMISSYGWGLCADTKGRRTTLLIAMPVGFVINLAASMAPNYVSLAVLKLLSVSFTSSANAAAFVLLAESVPVKSRSRFMFLMASATMVVQFIICAFALPIFKLTFHIYISWLDMEYRPWRLLLQVITLPGGMGALYLYLFLKESPKFLLSKDRNDDALEVFKSMYESNTGKNGNSYPVAHVYLDEPNAGNSSEETSLLKKMWNQTAPLFKPPLLRNSVMLYYLLLCAYMTSTGFTMWVPTMTNAYFTGDNDNTGQTFCDVASRSTRGHNITGPLDCDHIIQPMTLYATMCYSGISSVLTILLSFVVGPVGKKATTLMVFAISSICGIALLFAKIPLLSIALFFMFLYVAQILGNINSYLVELNPTHLRGMATCLSVVVARGSGFFSVQLIAGLLADNCSSMISGYVALVITGLLIATFLPPETKKEGNENTHPEAVQEDPESSKV